MITLADIPLLIPDSDGELMRWQEAFQSSEHYDLFGDTPAEEAGEDHTNYSGSYGVGLATGNYPPPPAPKINTFYFPCTGAVRWSRGYFLASTAQKDKLTAATNNFTSAVNLTFKNQDSDKAGLTFKVYPLAPRPITSQIDADKQLWLIPVTDHRYFLANASTTGSLRPDSVSPWTWANVYAHVKNQSGVDIGTLTADAAYLTPDKAELSRHNYTAGQVVDAIALSVGKRFVWRASGIGDCQSAADALKAVKARDYKNFVAGGFAAGPVQYDEIHINFPELSSGSPDYTGKQYRIIKSGGGVNGVRKSYFNIRCSAFGDVTNGATPANDANLQALATKIRDDYRAWNEPKSQYDGTVGGIETSFTPCGFDDCIVIEHGSQREVDGKPEYTACSRIKSLPQNFYPAANNCQDNVYITVLEHFQRGKASADIADGATGNFRFYNPAGTFYQDGNGNDFQYRVKNQTGENITTAADKIFLLHWHYEENVWKIISGDGMGYPIIRAKVYDDQIASNAPGYVLFWDESIANYVSAGSKTQIVNRECQQLFKDEIIFVMYNYDEQEYQPVRCEHWVQHGKFTANVAKGNTGTARRWVGGVEVAAVDITVRSRYRAVDKNRWIAFAWDENEWSVIEDEGYKHYRAKVDTIQIDSSASGPVKLFRDGAYDAGTTSVYVMEGHTPGLRDEIVWVTYTPEEDKYYITKTPVQVYRGKAITAITAGSTGTVHRYDRSGTLITDDLTVRSQMGSVEINAEIMFAWNGQEWEVVNKECP